MGFRFDKRQLDAKIRKALADVRAEVFRPQLAEWTRRGLALASRNTPVRDLATIRRNQAQQYKFRCNYIPSAHDLEDPSLRVYDDGNEMLYWHGKWYSCAGRIPDEAWAAYQALSSERQRRIGTAEQDFIAERAQARFLYRKSWGQVASSLGLRIPQAASVASSHSRHNPPENPPRGYGQWRGGKTVISVVIYNPFLQEDNPRYKPWDGKDIINAAMEATEPVAKRAFERQLKRVLHAVFR